MSKWGYFWLGILTLFMFILLIVSYITQKHFSFWGIFLVWSFIIMGIGHDLGEGD